MTQQWKSGAYPEGSVADDADDLFSELIGGVKSALTHYAGSADPQTGAWGAAEVGTEWEDTTNPDNPVTYRWERLTAVPAYGWRLKRATKTIHLETDVDALAAASTAVDVAWTALDLTAVLDASVQDAGQVLPAVRRVRLQVYVKITAGAHPTGLKCYVALRQTGTTAPVHYVCAQILNIPVYAEVLVGLDTGESLDYSVDTNAGGNTVAYGLKIIEAYERR